MNTHSRIGKIKYKDGSTVYQFKGKTVYDSDIEWGFLKELSELVRTGKAKGVAVCAIYEEDGKRRLFRNVRNKDDCSHWEIMGAVYSLLDYINRS